MDVAERAMVSRPGAGPARLPGQDDIQEVLMSAEAAFQLVPEWIRYYGGFADKIEGRVATLQGGSRCTVTLRCRLT
jgi:hypothetical protein